MTSPQSDQKDAIHARDSMLWFLAIASAVAILVVGLFAWIDSRSTPTIVFNATPSALIAIDVRGAISTPGVVYLEPGSRLIDVIDASGGLTSEADTTLINLSGRVGDGQMIVIPTQAPSGSSQTGLVNINTASVDDLKQLPGIGDVLAQRIVAYRSINGPYTSPDDLAQVEGISPTLVDSLRPYITVSGDD